MPHRDQTAPINLPVPTRHLRNTSLLVFLSADQCGQSFSRRASSSLRRDRPGELARIIHEHSCGQRKSFKPNALCCLLLCPTNQDPCELVSRVNQIGQLQADASPSTKTPARQARIRLILRGRFERHAYEGKLQGKPRTGVLSRLRLPYNA